MVRAEHSLRGWAENMKRSSPKIEPAADEMRAEYDFSGSVRGKHAKALREKGYVIRVHHTDGTYTERQVLGEKTVALESDVWEYFPDSQAVNHALRTLIALVSEPHKNHPKRERKALAKSRAKA
jgi:hypothetical protein